MLEGPSGHSQGEGSRGGQPEGADRASRHDRRVGVVERSVVSSHEVLGQGLDELVVMQRLEVIGGREVKGAAVAKRNGAVRNVADHVLHERNLAAAGRARFIVHGHQLAVGEFGDQLPGRRRFESPDRGKGVGMEPAAEHRGRQQAAALGGLRRSGRNQGSQCVRDLHLVNVSRAPTQHPGQRHYGRRAYQHLDRVQRHASRALDDPLAPAGRSVRGRAAARPSARRERFELDRGEAVMADAPVGRRSSSSGRASVTMRMGCARDQVAGDR